MNIFCGNLAWGVDNDDLLKLFQEHGSVSSAKVILERDSGKSRGFGFVEMPNDREAQKAIDAINGQELKGRKINVNEAKERTHTARGGFASGDSRRPYRE